jgi:hypothetical protein
LKVLKLLAYTLDIDPKRSSDSDYLPLFSKSKQILTKMAQLLGEILEEARFSIETWYSLPSFQVPKELAHDEEGWQSEFSDFTF